MKLLNGVGIASWLALLAGSAGAVGNAELMTKEEFLRTMKRRNGGRKMKSMPMSTTSSSSSSTSNTEHGLSEEERHDKLQEVLMANARRLGNNNNNNNNAYNTWFKSDVDVSGLSFDMSSFSFKYSGCAAIKSFDESLIQNYGSPMTIDTYAVFRLCPSSSCNKYSMTGCGKNFGEYVVEMSTFLEAMIGYQKGKINDYCYSCSPCSEQSAQDKNDWLDQCYYTAYANGWEEYYNAHDGDMSGYYAGYNNDNVNQGNQNYGYNYNNDNGNGDDDNNANRRLDQNANDDGAKYGNYDEYGNWVEAEEQPDANWGYWGEDGIWYPIEQANYEEEDDQCAVQAEELFPDCDTSACSAYSRLCEQSNDDDDGSSSSGVQLENYLQCTKYKDANGQKYYLAPHCGSDHFTLSIGMYSDANCANYLGKDMKVTGVLDMNFSSDGSSFSPRECISCDYNNVVSKPVVDENGDAVSAITGVCGGLHYVGAECERYMSYRNYNRLTGSSSSGEPTEEDTNCAFIENILFGAYDESGEIVLEGPLFNLSDWKNLNQYQSLKDGLSIFEIGGLLASFVLVLILCCVAGCTSTDLDDEDDVLLVDDPKPVPVAPAPWKPRRGKKSTASMDPLTLARQNSGIVMGRSQSGPGTTPLI